MMRRALTTFFAPGRKVEAGEEVDDKDAIMKGREDLFGPVEQATQAPGEARAAKRPAKKTAARKRTAAK